MTIQDKYMFENNDFFYDEGEPKTNSLRQDNELFNDEDYIAGQLVQVKKVGSKKNEDWKVLVDKKPVLIIRGKQLNEKQRQFLKTPEGVLFLIEKFKSGSDSALKLKALIKQRVK